MFDYNTYASRARGAESGGNDNARNTRSSSGGRYGFIDPTYLTHARRIWPGESDAQLLARKMDPTVQDTVMKSFTDDNIGILKSRGIPVNNASVYGAHHFGAEGASQLYNADDNMSAEQLFGSKVIQANPHLAGKTVAQVKQYLEQKGNGDVMSGGSGTPQVAGGAGMDTLQPPAEEQGIFSSLLGPGDGESWNLSDGLISAGAAAMARDNPSGAAALASTLKNTGRSRQKQRGELRTTYDPSTGRLIVFDPTTGQSTVRELGAPPEKPKEMSPEVIRKETEDFIKHDESAGRAARLAEQANMFREAISSGKLKMDLGSNIESWVRNSTNSSDEQSRLLNEFNTFKRDLQNFQLLAQKGVQTEGDATRALQQFFPNGVFDDKAVLERLDVLGGAARKDYERLYGYNRDILSRTSKVKEDGGVAYKTENDARVKTLKDWEEGYQKRRSQPANPQSSVGNKDGVFTSSRGYPVREIK